MSIDDVKNGFQAWREATSTSPFGDHLGIYKVLLKTMPESDDSPSTETIQENAWFIITTIINIGATFGLTLPRWEEAVCVMIEKAPGNLLLHKLRRIFIMASDYNMTLGTIVGRQLLWRAEDLNLLHKDLWGTRKDRSANDAALMKELTLGLSRITLTALATFDNDAKSCYDRVIMPLALIICRQLGLPKEAAAWIGNTTQRMKNFVKTGHGVTKDWFGSLDGSGKVKHGIGQGNRAAPAIWLFVSNLLFHILEKHAQGVKFFNPAGTRHHSRAADGYVDDVTGFTNLFERQMKGESVTVAELARATESDANLWNSLLTFSGGALELSKCFWYAIVPTGVGTLMTKEDLTAHGGNINIDSVPPVEVTLRAPTESHKTLGCHKVPDRQPRGADRRNKTEGVQNGSQPQTCITVSYRRPPGVRGHHTASLSLPFGHIVPVG